MKRYGYTRISTVHQDDELQRRDIVAAGVAPDDIFTDVITGSSSLSERPGWKALMDKVRPGDEICVWRLDRVGRSVADVVATVEELQNRDITVRSLVDGIDPTTAGGRMMLGMMATLAAYERDLIRERVKAGMAAAKARGVRFGRPPLDMKAELDKARIVKSMVDQGKKTVAEAGKVVGWSRATTYRRLQALEDHLADEKRRQEKGELVSA